MIALAVTWVANSNHEEEVAAIFRKLEAASRREPDCLMYVVHRHKDNPAQFFIYEQYSDEAALKTHWESAHFQEYAVKALQGIGNRLQGDLYLPLTS